MRCKKKILNTQQHKCDICLISISSPILLGIYIDNKLIKKFESIGKTSDILPQLFSEVMNEYCINRVFYANGPGNFSALKLTHIFLQTLSIINNIELFCVDSFYFTKDDFIEAYGRIHFLKENNDIKTIKLESKQNAVFKLPFVLDATRFSNSCFPLYILPATIGV